MIDLAGKTAVVFGLANKRSIAWGIAQKLHEAGATLAICYQNERMKLEAQSLIANSPAHPASSATSPSTRRSTSLPLSRRNTASSKFVHAVAYAPAEEYAASLSRLAARASASPITSASIR